MVLYIAFGCFILIILASLISCGLVQLFKDQDFHVVIFHLYDRWREVSYHKSRVITLHLPSAGCCYSVNAVNFFVIMVYNIAWEAVFVWMCSLHLV